MENMLEPKKITVLPVAVWRKSIGTREMENVFFIFLFFIYGTSCNIIHQLIKTDEN